MNRTVTRTSVVVVALLCATLVFAQNDREVLRVAAPFDRSSSNSTTRSDETVADACPQSVAMHPYAEPSDWPAARATVRLDQTAASTHVSIHLTGVRPLTRFSAWMRPHGAASGTVGSSEVPLSPRHVAAALRGNVGTAATVPSRGDDGLLVPQNDVWSDVNGDATFKTRVALPLLDPGSGTDAQALVALVIASHCTDLAGTTSQFGPRQAWFQWPSVNEAP